MEAIGTHESRVHRVPLWVWEAHVLPYLDVSDIVALSAVSRSMYALVHWARLWQTRVEMTVEVQKLPYCLTAWRNFHHVYYTPKFINNWSQFANALTSLPVPLYGFSYSKAILHNSCAPNSVPTLSPFSQLQAVDLAGVLSISSVASLRNVPELDLSGCQNLLDVSPLCMAQRVNLSGCIKLTDVSMLGGVDSLDLSFCTGLTNSSIQRLGKVRVLILRGCSRITDVSCLGDHQTLDLSLCSGISDVTSLSHVQKLILAECRNVHDVSGLRNVRHLDLSFCRLVTDLNSLKHVESLDLSYCRGITNLAPVRHVKSLYLSESVYMRAGSGLDGSTEQDLMARLH